MRAAIVVFPGTNRERDMATALRQGSGRAPRLLWHAETGFENLDLIVLPGGFSHGDYLRSGAMAARSPIMPAIQRFAQAGGHVLGVCNGFQVLTEAGLLPGALMRNRTIRFISRDCHLRVERADTAYTRGYALGSTLRVPMAHGDGQYVADAGTLDRLDGDGLVAFRYALPDGQVTPAANLNGSARGIAGITSANGRVLGMMPHPENGVDRLTGGEDGLPLFRGLAEALAA